MFSDNKGFFSIDAFFALLLLITVASGLLTIAQENKQAAQEIIHLQEQDMAAEKLAAGINTVYAKGTPLKLSFELPRETINENGNYKLSLDPENRLIIVENSRNGFSELIGKAAIIPPNVSNFTITITSETKDPYSNVIVFWENNSIKVEKC